MKIGPIATAMVTPFQIDGSINYTVTELLIEHLLSTGTDSLVVCGTTGESPTLTMEEKLKFIKFVAEKVNKRVPVIAGTGSNSTAASIDLSIKAEALGVDGLMIVTPYYNKPNQRGLIAHYEAIANETILPIIIYNIPSRSVINMELDTLVALSEIPSIKFLKDASGNLDQMTRVMAKTKGNLEVYSGDDSLTLPLLAIGGTGVISVASHIVGNDMKKMMEAFQNGNHTEAARIHQSLLPLIQALFKHPNPIVVKYALSKIGLEVGSLRLPLTEMTEREKQEFDVIWDEYLNTQ
ncbi:4-hydroxy-tetrahydrodipicolinate synthase [Psychrobacillus psychrotolerans]|uniref:4-hydroxy-tetrahydrodipicolinate synthase n=1 Tax=Psychrobacillus psychrotolerans TaxID=126156 RepID=A0A1I5WAL3_9BACI|nr:4-hydroxy-tetrahydrodipicolinate synthase [Psychrobacillus psychrotolerans]SFQ16725.1 4-hydroxy-tetrahydrodipicolinate synthase [Psychrobacillus psychrotolerans]